MDFWDRLEHEINRFSTRKAITMDVGIAQNSLSTWRKRGTYPSADVLVKIAHILGVSVEYLVTGSDRTDPWMVAEPSTGYGVKSWVSDHLDLIGDLQALPEDKLEDIRLLASSWAEKERSKTKHA